MYSEYGQVIDLPYRKELPRRLKSAAVLKMFISVHITCYLYCMLQWVLSGTATNIKQTLINIDKKFIRVCFKFYEFLCKED